MWQSIRRALRRWRDDDAALLSAAVAYYAALSMFPVLLVLIAGVGVFLEWTRLGQDAERQVLFAIGEQLSPALAHHVQQSLAQVRDNAAVTGPIGLLTLILAATAIFAQFEKAFDRIWKRENARSRGVIATVKNLVVDRFRAFLMLIGLGAIIGVVFVTGLVLSAAKAYTEGLLPLEDWTWWALQTAIIIMLNALAFSLIYVTLPKASVKWSEALQGGLLAAVTWEVGRQVLSAFVIGNKYNVYGVVGSLLAIMLWAYYGVAVLLLGAEFVQVICERCRSSSADERLG